MTSFLNKNRPPVYCPGCSHEKITHALSSALEKLALSCDQVAIVSDIGCSGLFDTSFNTHALHGTHGRALTYAAGIKLVSPETHVIVTMGDGGIGIGGAHLLAACRRNLNLTLIILNNFNFGMTGGQYSVSTPQGAQTGSGFLNNVEAPLDICRMLLGSGAGYVDRCSAMDGALSEKLSAAIVHDGFSVVETIGLCTGRFMKKNRVTAQTLLKLEKQLIPVDGPVTENHRPEYVQTYQKIAQNLPAPAQPVFFEKVTQDPGFIPGKLMLLGSAGMRIITAGEISCYAGMCAGYYASLKNDYNITVLRGQSVSEIIISSQKIAYAGIGQPDAIAALSSDGVERRKNLFSQLSPKSIILKSFAVDIPETAAQVIEVDFEAKKIKKSDQALASLAIFARKHLFLSLEMLHNALKLKLNAEHLEDALKTIEKTRNS